METYQRRRTACIEALKETSRTGLLVTHPKNIDYLTGFFTDPHERFMGLLWQESVGWVLLLPKLDMDAARQKVGDSLELIGIGDDQPAKEVIISYLRSIDLEALWIEENVLNYERVKWLLSAKPSLEINNISPALERIRMIKDHEEIQKLRRASEQTDQILTKALQHFKKGMTENDLAAEIEYQAKKAGAQGMSFSTTVLSQEKSALPHGKPEKRKIEEGLLLIDFGIVYEGYCSDMTRTFHIGAFDAKAQKIYETVLKAELAAIEQARVGMTFEELDRVAREVIKQEGYGEYFIHRLGHGMGIDVHEPPSIGAGNDAVIQEGMVFTIEPGIYIPQFGGVRIEDAVVMNENKAQPLTHFKKDMKAVSINFS